MVVILTPIVLMVVGIPGLCLTYRFILKMTLDDCLLYYDKQVVV